MHGKTEGKEYAMTAELYLVSLIAALVLGHGVWVLAYALSPRRVIHARLETYTAAETYRPRR